MATTGNVGGPNIDVLLFDTQAHTVVDLTGSVAAKASAQPVIAASGAKVAFLTTGSFAAADTDTSFDVYVYDTASGSLTLASTNASGVKANNNSSGVSLSADGSVLAFASNATNLSALDTDTTSDIYLKNLVTGAVTLVDVTAGGVKANGLSRNPSLSADGTQVLFNSQATNLAAGATDATSHVYLKNLTTGVLTLVDAAGGAAGNGDAGGAAISNDGTKVTYVSLATNLVANDTNRAQDVFLTTVGAATTPPAATPPAITGVPATETDPGQAAFNPFATAVVTGTETGQTYTVQLEADRHGTQQAGGTFSGGGFTAVNGDGANFSATSLAAVQAALRAVSFTPNSADTDVVYNIVSPAGNSAVGHLEILAPAAPPPNTPPTIGGAQAGQADTAGSLTL